MVSVSFRGGLPLLIFRIALFIKICKKNAMNFETFYKKQSSRRCPGGRGVAQVRTCAVGFPPGPGRGIKAFSRESLDAKSRGGDAPRPPQFRARSLALARFGVAGRRGTIVVFICNHFRALIWGLSFGKILFSIFSLENASQIGFSILEVIASRTHQRKLPQKLASGNERL